MIRQLHDIPVDIALGTELVHEYVVATADEIGQDIDVVLAIVTDLADFAGRYLRGGAFLVAETDGVIEGSVGVAPDADTQITPGSGPTCSMNRLWIRPAFRGRGLGRALCEAALETARDLGFRRMILDVLPQRAHATALYRSLGFVDAPPAYEYPFEMVSLGRDL